MGLFDKVFGSYSEREVKKLNPIISAINALEDKYKALTDAELKSKTEEFKERLKNGAAIDDILPDAFATVREASWRVLGMRPYDVQLIGGIILHQGRISEMKTGEGKTLVATLPAYLNALMGKGVHIVTVNDYLAKRDKQWMGKVYEFLGLTVGCIVHGISNDERKAAYSADITYGTNNEFGFDYLRDNMVVYKDEKVQRDLFYAIVDEVDSILIDEARTPLIISGQGDESTDLYVRARDFVKNLSYRVVKENEKRTDPFDREIVEETVDFLVNEKDRNTSITEQGTTKAERFFGVENLADLENMEIAHHINQALKARAIMHKDIDYVIEGGEIVIVDEFTGRLMYGRRYSEGLHQAIEAKEGLKVRAESKTLATITFQNYFRMYKKLSGMTGTAKTEEDEFREIYNMDVIEIPTNKPVKRTDLNDNIYANEPAKFEAVVRDIIECNEKGQPVLVGTITIEKSEELSKYLKRAKIPHEVLNAKYHDKESEIVAQAGRYGAVTIATNMAGRGTDILLGGNPDFLARHELKKKGYSDEVLLYIDDFYDVTDPEILQARSEYKELYAKFKAQTDEEAKKVVAAGGLHIIGTERHESRRIDNQLRGRSGRQGDPGSSKFFLSGDDDVIRIFAGDRFKNIMSAVDTPEDEPIENTVLTKLIESAQKKVESNNFGIRKHVLKYDDVMNKQREVIYAERKKVLEDADITEDIVGMYQSLIDNKLIGLTNGMPSSADWDMDAIVNFGQMNFGFDSSVVNKEKLAGFNQEGLINYFKECADEKFRLKTEEFGAEKFKEIERVILLRIVDSKWMDQIDAMDQLRQGVAARALGQQDPVRAYTNEGFEMFDAMNDEIREETVRYIFSIVNPDKLERKRVVKISENRNDSEPAAPLVKGKKVGRNELCPCGSGKKYKHCCGK